MSKRIDQVVEKLVNTCVDKKQAKMVQDLRQKGLIGTPVNKLVYGADVWKLAGQRSPQSVYPPAHNI